MEDITFYIEVIIVCYFWNYKLVKSKNLTTICSKLFPKTYPEISVVLETLCLAMGNLKGIFKGILKWNLKEYVGKENIE